MGSELLFFPAFTTGEAPWKVLARIQIESLALMSRRAQAYMELPQTLSHCRTPEDLMTEQVRFWQVAQRQYAAGFEKVAGAVPVPLVQAPKVETAQPRPRDYIVVAEREPAVAPTTAPIAAKMAEQPKAVADPLVRTRIRRSA